jgi:hypothetical protein
MDQQSDATTKCTIIRARHYLPPSANLNIDRYTLEKKRKLHVGYRNFIISTHRRSTFIVTSPRREQRNRTPQEPKTKTLTLTDLCADALRRPPPRQAAAVLALAPVLAALVPPQMPASLVPGSQPEARVLLGPAQVDMERHALGV